jgi:hypothetical protein
MIMDIFSSASWLNTDSNIAYGTLPIPNLRDREITHLIETWVKLDEVVRQGAAKNILESQRFTLLAYSERMASLAVRTRDPQKIFLGLLALGVDGWKGDWRENAEILCLHYDAAKRIGVIQSQVFEKAASFLSLKVAMALRSFVQRSPSDQSLEAMGYSAASDDDGFRYKRDW